MKTFAKYAFEFILLFAAVTTSFWVENYRENQNEKETIKNQLESFADEFRIVKDSMRLVDYDFYMSNFHQICSLVRNDEDYSLSDSTFGYLSGQRYFVMSDFLDDLYAASTITERPEYRHVTNDSLSSFFFRLNDYGAENFRLMEWAFEMDQKMTLVLERYDLHGKFYSFSDDSAYVKIKPFLSSIQTPEEEARRWKLFTNDKQLKNIVAEIQVLHMDAFFLHENSIKDFEETVGAIEREIDGL